MTPRQINDLRVNAKTAPVLETLVPTEAISTRYGVLLSRGNVQPLIRTASAATQEACL
jgi:hypothetical protein